jgi:putative hemolysin
MKKLFFILGIMLFIVACTPKIGGDKDIHGCIGSAGYSWCEAKQKCLRIWEENCTVQNSQIANPASVFCEEQNGTLEIRDSESGQVGYCHANGKECEEWAYFRGECKLD